MNSLSISFSKAVELLKVSEDEVLEIEKYLYDGFDSDFLKSGRITPQNLL